MYGSAFVTRCRIRPGAGATGSGGAASARVTGARAASLTLISGQQPGGAAAAGGAKHPQPLDRGADPAGSVVQLGLGNLYLRRAVQPGHERGRLAQAFGGGKHHRGPHPGVDALGFGELGASGRHRAGPAGPQTDQRSGRRREPA